MDLHQYCLEALINSGKEHPTRQFKTRVSKLASSVAVEFTEADAGRAYDFRSRLAHGQGLAETDIDNETINLYERMETLLRFTLRRTIMEPAFAQIFTTDKSIRESFPIS